MHGLFANDDHTESVRQMNNIMCCRPSKTWQAVTTSSANNNEKKTIVVWTRLETQQHPQGVVAGHTRREYEEALEICGWVTSKTQLYVEDLLVSTQDTTHWGKVASNSSFCALPMTVSFKELMTMIYQCLETVYKDTDIRRGWQSTGW